VSEREGSQRERPAPSEREGSQRGRASPSVDIRAAGGMLWRRSSGGVEIAIVHRPKYDDWSLPKGKLRAGEHPLLGACREVVEETGVVPAVGRKLPAEEYWLGPDRKTVDYWAMAAIDGGFAPNDEVDGMRWLHPAEAATWLSYDRDRELLRAFLAVPLPTATLLLVRHARAGERSAWVGEDRLRPLEPAGREQALALRESLAWFAPERIFSADPVRCVESVVPLAEKLDLPVENEPALSEESFTAEPERGLRRIRAIARLGVRAVICSQGAVIPPVVSTLAAEAGLPLRKVPARKASVWALSMVDGLLTAADYYPDLAEVA
jgi:8-oxo-(d)GTP phosphatase